MVKIMVWWRCLIGSSRMQNLVFADWMLRTVSMQSFLNFFNEQISFSKRSLTRPMRWSFYKDTVLFVCCFIRMKGMKAACDGNER